MTDDPRARRLAAHEQTKRVARAPITAAEARDWFAHLVEVADDARNHKGAR